MHAADSSRNGTGPWRKTFTEFAAPAGTATNGNGFAHTDPLSPAQIAHDEMLADGIDIWVEPERAVLTADEILKFEVPPTDTLPVLGRSGLIMEGAANLLYSYPKLGKTELLTAMVAEWIGQDRRVLYLTEEGFPNWKVRLAVHGCSGSFLRMMCSWAQDLARALEVIRSEEFDILIVDTLRNTVGYLEGDGDKDVARVIHPLLSAAAPATVVCSFHARKMPGEGGRDISGHHALYGAFDRALQLTGDHDRPDQRKITVSGRCMYQGDVTLFYRQIEPGHFEALDSQTVTERKDIELQCLDCGEWFTAKRKDARFCSATCRQHHHRDTTTSEKNASQISSPPRETRSICDTKLDGEWP